MIYFIFIFLSLFLYKFVYQVPNGYTNAYIEKSDARLRFTVVSCILLVIIIGLKDISVGTDTERYYYHFLYDEIPDWHNGNIAGMELGFGYLQYFCKEIGIRWAGFSCLTALIIVAPMGYFFYKYSDNIWASFLFYMTIGMFSMNMTGLRQSLAVAMVLMATISLFEKRYIQYLIFVLIGYLFHYSALIALVLCIVPLIKYRNNFQLTILLFVPLLVRLFGSIIFGHIGGYLPDRYDGYESQTFTMNPILEMMWFSILTFGWYSLIKNKNISDKEFSFFFLTVCFVSCVELSHHFYLASRLSHYFENIVVAAIPCFIYKFQPSNNRNVMSLLIYTLCMIAFMMTLMGSDTLSISDYSFMTKSY